jgi:hypothetical protein
MADIPTIPSPIDADHDLNSKPSLYRCKSAKVTVAFGNFLRASIAVVFNHFPIPSVWLPSGTIG